MMFDPNYDPFEELETCKVNIQQIVLAFNDQRERILELQRQNQKLITALIGIRSELDMIKNKLP
jgi:hypothetical protein